MITDAIKLEGFSFLKCGGGSLWAVPCGRSDPCA